MSSFCDNKIALCAGVVGVFGAGVLGYVIGRRSNIQMTSAPYFLGKSHSRQVESQVLDYVLKHSLREPEPLRKIKEDTFKSYGMNLAKMLGAAEESQLFRFLFPFLNARKVIEIGVFTGYNSLNFALNIPADGKVIACDVTDEYVNAVGKPVFKEAGVENKIDLRIQSAVLTLDELLANGEADTYDFVFIDADKSGYDVYYEKSLKLLRKGGIIAIDNVLYQGRVVLDPSEMQENERAIHRLNEKVHKDSRVDMVMIPFADGVTLVTKL